MMPDAGLQWQSDRKIVPSKQTSTKLQRNNDDDTEEDDNENPQQRLQPGMADAFRQLDSLTSLNSSDSDQYEYTPAPAKIAIDAALAESKTILSSPTIQSTLATDVSPEQDFVVYKNMMVEMEENDIATSYTEVLDELGDSALQTDDTYSQIMTELGGTKMKQPTSMSTSVSTSISDDDIVENPLSTRSNTVDVTSEQLLNNALNEALSEVQLNHPKLSESRILNDKEMMKEIEAIFDQGNAKLFESIEEIRREQVR
jgi:hypothetical protein